MEGVTIRGLVDAVQAGDLARVDAMLRARPELADLTVSYGDERRAIHYAVLHRRPEIVRLLMRQGANARAGIHPHRRATTAWILARERGYDEIVAIIEEEEAARQPEPEAPESVVEDDATRTAAANGDLEWLRARRAEGRLDINPVRWDDGGLLTVAVEHGRIDILRYLLDECGFDPDERVSSGAEGDWIAWSQGFPLWNAAALGRLDLAKLLLDRGANPNVHVNSSGSAVYSAYSHQQWEMVELLRARGGIVTGDIAAIYRQTEVAQQILREDPRQAEEMLRFAGDGGAVDIVRLALEHIDWPHDDKRWFGPLSSLLSFWHHIPWLYAGNKEFDREGYMGCFRLILSRCDVNVRGGFGRAILHEIAAMGDWITGDEVAAFGREALQAGARMDGRDEILESTPLGWACRWGRAELVSLLLAHGADPNEIDAAPWARPRTWAQKMGHAAIVRML